MGKQIVRTHNIPNDSEHAAISGAAAPSVGNVFATMADVSAVNLPADPTLNDVPIWNGSEWVAAPADTIFDYTFSIDLFTDSLTPMEWTGSEWVAIPVVELIGVGEWLAAEGITFTITYTNGPATAAHIDLTLRGGSDVWNSPLALSDPFEHIHSAEAVDYPALAGAIYDFTLTAQKALESVEETHTFTFQNYIRYGNSILAIGDENSILALSGKVLSTAHVGTFPVTGEGYFIVAHPARLTNLHATGFLANGKTLYIDTIGTISVTNEAGFTEDYRYYQSFADWVNSGSIVTSLSDNRTDYIYWGVSEKTDGYVQADVTGAGSSALSNTKGRVISVTAGTGEYIIYCIPERLDTVTFWFNGLETDFGTPEVIEIANFYGYRQNYRVYRSPYSGYGNTTIEVI